ncbi:hypothetical protein [Helicobacter cappadocius]|uniref:ABC-type transport auxiliary lipoprotein component domain-containing protein n=1 Tax=Helicobacter cappadocius TaxID=3063998 RepID=A0AA90PQS8_9HELI|nr:MULTISPECIES: hypothetical protein [unclassified Helicobacter]MDO7252525.1 hypothetical protein [Helicobacter sp. faydin-H75]MDP2538392.1 hypothetical protein [Helicobacter sp. faydin-H76]
MKKLTILIFPIFILFLTGCISLKIKSELPTIYSYDFNANISPTSCETYKNIALIDIDSTGIYESKKIIVRNDDGRITNLEGKQWIDSPKNIFRDLLIQEGAKHCISINLPPFGTQLPQNVLKLTLVSLEIRNGNHPSAQMVLGYNLAKSGKKMNGFLQETQEIQGDDIKALQEVAKNIVNQLVKLFGE